ncbi:MAG: Anaerobic sulfatase-maturating enzyme [Syntrophomonadaceae bacterium]|nr:Anaerobic sulfatase-maturating enzyme [Bacillota bacterium]MBT9147167.1 Anaerobic sulfatase-maturating enzyme [Bacillota bacterium]
MCNGIAREYKLSVLPNSVERDTLEQQTLVTSRYVHLYQSGRKVAAYHALTMDSVFGGAGLSIILQQFRMPTKTGAVLDQVSGKSKLKQAKQVIATLLKLGFLRNPDDPSEDLQLARLRKEALKSEVRFLYIVPTTHCNLRCVYCHIGRPARDALGTTIEVGEASAAVDLFARFASQQALPKEIMFYGGEPLIAFNRVEEATLRAQELSRQGAISGTLRISIFTNATLVTPSIARRLANLGITVVVSIDGPPGLHDIARVRPDGSGSYKATARGLCLLREAGCTIGLSLVVGEHNVAYLPEAVDYLQDMFRPADIGLSTLHLFADGSNPAFVPMTTVTQALIETFRRTRQRSLYVEHIFRRVRPFVERLPRLKDCPSCGGKIVVVPGYRVGFCEAFMESDFYVYPVSDFKLTGNKDYDRWCGRAPVFWNECLDCSALTICGGGCPYDAWAKAGDIFTLDTGRCEQARMLLEWLIWDLAEQTGWQSWEPWSLFIPTSEARYRIYGLVRQNRNIPLQEYSRFGEYLDLSRKSCGVMSSVDGCTLRTE